MPKVLLAIDGITPTRLVFEYAVQLCRRMKADLSVLQLIRPDRYRAYLKNMRRHADQAQRCLEGSMMAAAFAEAGETETAKTVLAEARKNLNELLPDSERAGVAFCLTTKSGHPGQEIVDFVKHHRDVVLTIYDPSEERRAAPDSRQSRNSVPENIRRRLSTPVVVVERRKAHGTAM